MASSARRITVEFLGEDKSLSRTASSVDSHTSKLGSTFKNVGKAAAIGLAGGLVAAGGAIVSMTKNAIEDEAAQRKLATALKNSVNATDDQVASVEDYISKVGMATGVTDDEMRPAFQRLVESTGSITKAQKEMDIALDVSAGTGKSLKTVTEALMKANNGTTASLSKLGLKTKDAEGNTLSLKDALSKMSDTFKGQAEARADSMQGKMDRLKLIFDETKESIGAKFIPIATALADMIIEDVVPALQEFSAWFSENIKPKLEEFARVVQEKFDEAVAYVKDHMDEIKAFIRDSLDIIKTIWQKWGDDIVRVVGIYLKLVWNGIKGAFTVIRGIFKVFSGLLHGDWAKVWDGIKDIVKGVWILIKGVVQAGWSLLKEIFKLGGEALKGIMHGIWDGIKALVGSGIESVVDSIRRLPERLRTLGDAFKKVGGFLIGAFIKGLEGVGGVIGGIAGTVWDALKGLINSAIDAINRALEFSVAIGPKTVDVNPPDIPHLAGGSRSFAGGMAVVGEYGPEMVSLPRGSRVFPAGESARMGDFTASAPLVLQVEGRTLVQAILTFKRRNGNVELGIA